MENSSETLLPSPFPGLSERENVLLARVQEIADTVLEPRAESVDQSGIVPADNLRSLAEAGLVGVTTPVEWGGQACSGNFQREFTETLTAACGTTWFVLTQHLGACSMLAGSSNPALREQYLRAMASGDHYVGVGFGHLRRPAPMLRAVPVDGGWVLNGVAPWVTGWPILKGVIFGAVLPDEESGGQKHLYVYAPATENDRLRSTPPLPLCAMNATATTEVHLENLFVPQDQFVKYSSRAEMMRGDQNGIAGPASHIFGCARGSLKQLRAIAARRSALPAIARAADSLEAEINACRAECLCWSQTPDKSIPEYRPQALKARAWTIELAVRAAHMAVAASGGAANSLEHPAQRRFREAMFYTLTAQTADIMGATLDRVAD
ncbi:MAG: acyl-CoA/acyl-ACP dehydrogenase [Cytophagales bacterium]|nr:acyl-CoA/acyl-ACP dehydrogenase [Armatimonadota bacterium]